jgi:hypothetical protein
MLLVHKAFMDTQPERDEKLERELRIRRRRIAEITGRTVCLDCAFKVETDRADRCRRCRERHDHPDR